MKSLYNDVKQFRQKLLLPVSDTPALLESVHLSFYARFLMEELSELLKAHEQENLVDAADAVADLIYVAMGCAHHMGLPLPQILDVVHQANMGKVPGSTRRGVSQDAQKPDEWVGPEAQIKALLNA